MIIASACDWLGDCFGFGFLISHLKTALSGNSIDKVFAAAVKDALRENQGLELIMD